MNKNWKRNKNIDKKKEVEDFRVEVDLMVKLADLIVDLVTKEK